MPEKSKAKSLLDRFRDGLSQEAEQNHIERWWLGYENPSAKPLDEGQMANHLAHIRAELMRRAKKPIVWRRWAAAAVLIGAMGLASVYFWSPETGREEGQVEVAALLPATTRATLRLANGQQLLLDSAQAGVTMRDGRVQYDNGEPLIDNQTGDELLLTTPKGGYYQLQLEDGTTVWLNVASSIKYPQRFGGRNRYVEITGEALLDVAQDSKRPFIVKSGSQEITVLGTVFNVRHYIEEPGIQTTLLQGRVRVANSQGQQELSPGEQTILSDDGTFTKTSVDTDAAIAWRKGRISLEDRSFVAIVNDLARWYDLEIVYTGPKPEISFYGDLVLDDLKTVLGFLESGGVTYELSGRVLYINGTVPR